MLTLTKKKIVVCMSMVVGVLGSPTLLASTVTTWTTTIDAGTYSGTTGTIQFNDWGYKGPTGVGATDFKVGAGFDHSRIGQIQHVVTREADGITRDPAFHVSRDFSESVSFPRANMDGQVNFYKWGYTTPPDSTFSNMQIDKAGNYNIAKGDMSFGFYDVFNYIDTAGTRANTTFDTNINFQPYAISDAQGWCGSVLNENPNGVGVMAGQVTFDFAMDVYFETGTDPGNFSSTQLIPGFIMRSYGDYVVNLNVGGEEINYYGSAVMNNNNPAIDPLDANGMVTGAALDPAYQNLVSFLGAGVVPNGVWVSADSFNPDGSRKMRLDSNPTTGVVGTRWDVTIVPGGTPGAVWHNNAFSGYGFMLRADGSRTLDFISPSGHSDYVVTTAVPVPPAVWLLATGLFSLLGAVRRRKH